MFEGNQTLFSIIQNHGFQHSSESFNIIQQGAQTCLTYLIKKKWNGAKNVEAVGMGAPEFSNLARVS